jgi:predicted DNA-binding WGR domain protein
MATGQQKRFFEFKDDKSAKFWEVATDGTSVTVRYGKIGTNGQSQTKEFADTDAASKHVAKLVAEKTGKGYVESGVSAVTEEVSESVAEVPLAAAPRKKATPTRKTSVTNPAKDPDASPESLLALLDKDDTTNRLLARHPKASADLLEKLSHSSDKATRQAVCLNPNASKDVLSRLAPQFPGEFFLNPAFDWLLLEDPDFLFNLGQGVLKNILKRPDCPKSFMQWAIKHGSEAERLALTMNPSTPEELVKSLSKHKGSVGDAAKGRTAVGKNEYLTSQDDLEAAYLAEVKKALSEVKPDEVQSAYKRGMITGAQRPWLNLDCRILLADLPLSLVVIGAMKGREQELAAFSHPEVRAWVAHFLEHENELLETLSG